MVFASPLPDVEIPDVALTEYVLEHAARLGDKPRLIDGGSGRTLTYAGLEAAVRSLAGGLAARGFGPGSCWPSCRRTSPSTPSSSTGSRCAGGTITTINPTYTERRGAQAARSTPAPPSS